MNQEKRELFYLELVAYALEEQEDGTADLNATVCDLVSKHTTPEQYARFTELMQEIGEILGIAITNADKYLAEASHNE